MNRILEHHTAIPRPISLVLAYPALDFNFTSWMSPANLRVLRTEQSEAHIPGLVHGKDHMRHKSPLSVVDDVAKRRSGSRARQRSWGEVITSKLPGMSMTPAEEAPPNEPTSPRRRTGTVLDAMLGASEASESSSEGGDDEDEVSDTETVKGDGRRDAEKSLRERVKTPRTERFVELAPVMPGGESKGRGPIVEGSQLVAEPKRKKKTPIGTRLTMTSRVGYFQDRIISPSMVGRRS